MVEKLNLTPSKVQKGSALDSSKISNLFFMMGESSGNTSTDNDIQELKDLRTSFDGIQYDRAGTAVRAQIQSLNGRINNVARVKEGSTTGDVELVDARVGYDGTNYINVGTAIREQISHLNKQFEKVQDIGKSNYNQVYQTLVDIGEKHTQVIQAKEKAQNWAEKPTVVEIDSQGVSHYSAKYWADQAVMQMIPDGAVSTNKIVDGAINTNKLSNESVSTNKIVDESITTSKVANGSITSSKLSTELNTSLNNLQTNISSHTTQIGEINSSISSLSSGKVDKSGDTISGDLILNASIKKSSNDGFVRIMGGATDSSSANLLLTGGGFSGYNGRFQLVAADGTTFSYLEGLPNGNLYWGNKPVETVIASGTNYIRYNSGLQICWGSIEYPAYWEHADKTTPVPFVSGQWNLTATVLAGWDSPHTVITTVAIRNTDEMQFVVRDTNNGILSYVSYVRYIAIGKWK